MKQKQLIQIIEELCPSDTAEEWDNCGYQIQCGTGENEVRRLLVALEVTSAVIEEAAELGAELILTHHPMLFHPIHKLSEQDLTGSYLFQLIRENISVYSCHTSFDKLDGGNNDYLGALLELERIRSFPENDGFCRMGQTPFDVTFMEVIHKAAQALSIDQKYFRWVGDLRTPIERIGWCTGAGSEFIAAAQKAGCDLFITGDLKYHDAQMAKELGICVLDAGHYGSEKIFAENMAQMLAKRCADASLQIYCSEIDLNPFD